MSGRVLDDLDEELLAKGSTRRSKIFTLPRRIRFRLRDRSLHQLPDPENGLIGGHFQQVQQIQNLENGCRVIVSAGLC